MDLAKGNASNYLNSTIDMDSAIVMFGNTIEAIHYGYNKVGLNTKAILFGNPRNIFGGSSTGGWQNRIVSETKHHIETELNSSDNANLKTYYEPSFNKKIYQLKKI